MQTPAGYTPPAPQHFTPVDPVEAPGRVYRTLYHGCRGTLELHRRVSECNVLDWISIRSRTGHLIHLEPHQPTGRAFDTQQYADRAVERGAYLSVDSTVAPPVLQDPLKRGADIVMHFGRNYLGCHSDFAPRRPGCKEQTMVQDATGRPSVFRVGRGRLPLAGLDPEHSNLRVESAEAEQVADYVVQALQSGLLRHESGFFSAWDATTVRSVVNEVHHASVQEVDAAATKADASWLWACVRACTLSSCRDGFPVSCVSSIIVS